MAEIKNNIVDLEVVYSKLNATIDRNIDLLKEGATAVDAYNKKISVVPSEFQKSLTDIKTKTDAITKSTEQSRLAEIKLQKAREQAFDKFEQSFIKQEKLAQKNAQKQIDESNRIIAQKEKEFAKFEKEFNKYEADLAKKAIAEQKANQKSIQLSEQARLKELQLAKQREQAFDKYDKQLAREQAKLQASENLYNKLQLEMNKLVSTYQNLATRKERGATLTKVEAEQMSYLEKRIKTLDTSLKAVDATTGKYSRNVGNYVKSGFNPLGNSINQLTREMPAFTYSVQTGFMALSNNIPIFTDAIGNAVRQNKELIAQGQPTTSVLKQVASALFSFQTLLGVGITLLTVYGKEIGEWIKGLGGANAVLDELNANQKEFNDSRIQGRKDSISDRTELEKYVRTMRNSNITLEERNIALKKIRDQFPFYFKNLTDEQLLNGNISKELATLNLALERRAVLQKATDANVKNKQRLVDLQIELDLLNKQEKLKRESLDSSVKNNVSAQGLATLSKELNKVQERRNEIIKATSEFEKAIISNNTTINELKTQTIGLEYTETEAKKEKLKVEEELFKAETNSKASFQENINALEAQLNVTSKLNPVYGVLELQLRLLKDAYEALYGEQKKQESVQDPKFGTLEYYEKLRSTIQNQQKTIATTNPEWEHYQRLLEAVQIDIDILTGKQNKLNETFFDAKGYFKGFVDSFASNSGFSEIFKAFELLDQNFETAEDKAKVVGLAISEAFQQAFNTIAEYSQRNFDAEYERLERQRDHAIEMAGGSATAREEIERQYEERRKAIARRQAQEQKNLAIFNAVIDTAQGVVGAIARADLYPYNFVLAGIIGALGAAQIALISSQPVPQFWKGTDNAPEGLAWTQEKGAEVITDKNGNVKTLGSDKGAQLTYLSKGDKVYKSHEDYINKVLSKNGISDLGSYMNFAPKMEINNGITKEDLDQNFSKLASVIKNKEGINISIDERGFRKKQGNTEFINSRLNLTSRQV